jgi:hypothetical protein
MNISGLSPSTSAYASTANRSTGAAASPADGKKETQKGKSGELKPEEAAQIAKLKQIDRQVRQHEQAHMAAAGGMVTAGASFTYQKGPDGVSYAVGGEVGISTAPGRTPEETIRRAQTIRTAALAPADPSGQDRAVAAQAGQMEQQARIEQAQKPTGEEPSADSQDARRQTEVASFYAASPESSGRAVSIYA